MKKQIEVGQRVAVYESGEFVCRGNVVQTPGDGEVAFAVKDAKGTYYYCYWENLRILGEISYDEGFQEGYRTGLEEAAQKCEESSARFKFDEPCKRCNKEHPLFPSCGVNDGYRMGLRDAFKEAAMVIRALIGEKK